MKVWDGDGCGRRACATCTACSSASSAAWRRREHASRPAARCSATASAVAPASRSPAGVRRVMRRARSPCGSGRREHAAIRAGTAGAPSYWQPRRQRKSRQARARAAARRTRAALPGGLCVMQPALCAGCLCGSRRSFLGCSLSTERASVSAQAQQAVRQRLPANMSRLGGCIRFFQVLCQAQLLRLHRRGRQELWRPDCAAHGCGSGARQNSRGAAHVRSGSSAPAGHTVLFSGLATPSEVKSS
jgi:hypothetical protein